MIGKIVKMLFNVNQDQQKLNDGRRENLNPRVNSNLGQVIGFAGAAAAFAGGVYLVIKTATELMAKPTPKVHGRMERRYRD